MKRASITLFLIKTNIEHRIMSLLRNKLIHTFSLLDTMPNEQLSLELQTKSFIRTRPKSPYSYLRFFFPFWCLAKSPWGLHSLKSLSLEQWLSRLKQWPHLQAQMKIAHRCQECWNLAFAVPSSVVWHWVGPGPLVAVSSSVKWEWVDVRSGNSPTLL